MAKLWSERDDALARKLWAEGFSASEIGAQLGRTRNAVIGRVHRLKLQKRGQQRCSAFVAHRVRKQRQAKPRAPRPPRPRSQSPRFKPSVAAPERMPNVFDASPASQAALALLGAANAADRRRDLYRSNALGRTQ